MQKKGFVFCLQIFILNEIIYFSRPFREININNNSKSWDRVYKLQKGKVYVEVNFILKKQKTFLFFIDSLKGNLTTLVEMTHWEGHDVLYIGDHIYGDLAVRIEYRRLSLIEIFFKDLFLTHGWRTGAILEEVEV